MTPITVVVPTLNREEPLVSTLRQILAQRADFEFETIVIDQSDSHRPETAAYLESIAGTARIERVPFKNLSEARNLGARLASAEIVLYLDDDNPVWPGTVNAHAEAHREPGVAAVTGPLFPRAELIAESRFGAAALRALKEGRETNFQAAFPYDCPQLNGCNMSIKKEWIARAGGFDTNFFGAVGGDDFEFSYRLRRAGGRIVYRPGAGVDYTMCPTGGCRSLEGAAYVESKVYNNAYYLFRVGTPFFETVRRLSGLYRHTALHRQTLPGGLFVPLSLAFFHGVGRAWSAHRAKRALERGAAPKRRQNGMMVSKGDPK